MDKLIPYIIVTLVAFAAGAFAFKSCQSPKVETITNTVSKTDTLVRIVSVKPEVRERIVYREVPTQTDDSPCWPLLKAAYADLDEAVQQNWYLSELEVEGEIEQGPVTGRIGFSMPRFQNSGQGFVYDLRAKETTIIQEPKVSFFDRFGYGLHVGAGASLTPAGTYPSVYVGLGFQFDLTGAF
jgi:hypothetical protein